MGFLWTRNLIFGSAESFIWNTYIRFFLIGFPNLLRFWFFRFLFFLDSLSDSHRDFLFPLMGSYFLSLLVDSLVFRKFRDFRFRFFWEFSSRLPWWTEPTIILEFDWMNWKTVFQFLIGFFWFYPECILNLYGINSFIIWTYWEFGIQFIIIGCQLFFGWKLLVGIIGWNYWLDYWLVLVWVSVKSGLGVHLSFLFVYMFILETLW